MFMREFALKSLLVMALAAGAVPESPARAAPQSPGEPGTARILGTVTDLSGRAQPGARVIHRHSGGATGETAADAQGRYVIEQLQEGLYTLEARVGDDFALTTEVRIGRGETLTLQLRLRPVVLTDEVTVTATALTRLQRAPGGVAEIPNAELRRSRAGNLRDVFGFVPGVLAQPRWGAEEAQLSIRGSGLRNNFHMRGVNLLINGMPYQEADGFGDFESIELMATQRIEVWKGANALRYGGNTSGGAINFVTYTGANAPALQIGGVAGAHGFVKAEASSGGLMGPIEYFTSGSVLDLDGYRGHSEQRRRRGFANIAWAAGPRDELRLDLMAARVEERLPGALTRAEFESDPDQANPATVQGDWGREYDYYRAGLEWRRRLSDAQSFSVSAFANYRDMIHPIFQILDQVQRNAGGEASWSGGFRTGQFKHRVLLGIGGQFGDVDEERFANVDGQRGALANAFGTEATSLGVFVEDEIAPSPTFSVTLAARADQAERPYTDRFLADGDRSDDRTYRSFTPKVGASWRPDPASVVFANVSRAYEPPLVLELTSFGAPGLLDLDAQDTWQYEIGSRGHSDAGLGWDVALYHAEVENEILNIHVPPFPGAPFTVPSYRNADRSRHSGLELGLDGGTAAPWLGEGGRLHGRAAYTWSRFRYVDDATFGGNQIPGAPEHLLRAELRGDLPAGFWVAPSVDWSPESYAVNSENSEMNDPYAVLHVRAGLERDGYTVYAELNNLTDERYSPSVQVDTSDARFFEPASGRAFHAGVRWWWNGAR
jgi:iron complex outermembrane receptor protein